MSTYIRHKMTETETVCSDETKLSETKQCVQMTPFWFQIWLFETIKCAQ